MASLQKNGLLELPPNGIEEIRKLHNLDKPGRVDEAIDLLVEWIKKQDHILKKDFDRDYLGRALIASKGSVEKAKKQIDRLCTMKSLLPHFFVKTNLKVELEQMLELAWLVPLPRLTEDYYRILMIKINDKGFSDRSFLEYFQYNVILCEYLKAHDYVNGFILIDDYRDANVFELVSKIDTVQLQQYMAVIVEGFGARIKGIHLITQSKAIDLFVKMMKQFLSQKISSRMHVHKTLEDLYTMVPRELLPIEYGGKERSIIELKEEWIEELSSKEHVEYMKMMNKAGTDEKLRRSDKFNDEYMGMPGAFRNLSVD